MAYVSASGAITGNATLELDLSSGTISGGTVVMDVSGTWGSSIYPEYTLNGTDWYQANISNYLTLDGLLLVDIQTNGIYAANVAGVMKFRLRGSGVTGTANCNIGSSEAVSIVSAVQGVSYVEQISSSTWNVAGPLTDAELRATPLPISGSVSISGGGDASAANQVTGNASLSSINTKIPALGQAVMASSAPVVIASNQTSIPVAATLQAGAASIGVLGANSGVDIGDVTINNASGASAVNIQDGGNSITVDGSVSVSGSVAVTGPLTDAQLRAVAVPVSGTVTANAGTNLNTSALALETTQSTQNTRIGDVTEAAPASDTASSGLNGRLQRIAQRLTSLISLFPTSLGQKTMANSLAVTLASDQSTLNVSTVEASVLFKGKASTYNTPGRAGTAGQKILSLHNATGSSVTVKVLSVKVDGSSTVVKAITVPPPIIRLWKVTVLPTNGTALTKNKIGGTTTSSASVTVLGDASADGTGSATTLTATLPAGTILEAQYAARFITAAGYEPADVNELNADSPITLSALEGVVVFLDYTLATQNPTTDRWIASIEWTES